MYCTRPVSRSPSVYRLINKAPARSASFFPTPFFPRGGSEFAPFFRLLDDFTSPQAFGSVTRHQQSFQPRFDVREVGETYELRGEVPGVEQKDLEVEFTDPQTLIIRGRTEREYTSGTPAAVEAAETTKAVTNEAAAEEDKDSDAASTYSTGSYQRPSVEDEEGAAGSSTEAQAIQTPAETPAVEKAEPQTQAQEGHYWVSERSTGSFQRVFNFGQRIDQDAVKASLKNGILNIVVPKAAIPAARKITVQ